MWPRSVTQLSAALPGPALPQARFISAWKSSHSEPGCHQVSVGTLHQDLGSQAPGVSGSCRLLPSATPCSSVEQAEGNSQLGLSRGTAPRSRATNAALLRGRARAPFQDKAPRVAPVSELSSRSRNAGAASAGGAKPGLSLGPSRKGSEDEAGSQPGAARGENLRRLLAGAPRGAGIAESCSRAPAPRCRVSHPVMQKASV